jgi:hypothetical protein
MQTEWMKELGIIPALINAASVRKRLWAISRNGAVADQVSGLFETPCSMLTFQGRGCSL